VIIDCTDFALNEDSLASELFTPDFYSKIFQLLSPGAGFSQQITDLICKDEFTRRASLGGFSNNLPGIVMAKTPEYGGELPIAYCHKPP
jgi:spermidine synthase